MSASAHPKVSPAARAWHSWQVRALGSTIAIHLLASHAEGEAAIAVASRWLERFEAEVSRFRPDSDTSALNRDGRVQARPRLQACVRASLWAAELTGGLVDPLVTRHLEAAGYDHSRADGPELDWDVGLRELPAHVAEPDPLGRWRLLSVQDGVIRLPDAAAYDPGAVGKGLAADTMLAICREEAPGAEMVCVDCGGDVALWSDGEPWSVELHDPRSRQPWTTVEIACGGLATSAVTRRMWRADGQVRHHLLSPADGRPINCGLAGVAALAGSALEAEVRAKWALLSGDDAVLREGGWLYPADPAAPPRSAGLVD